MDHQYRTWLRWRVAAALTLMLAGAGAWAAYLATAHVAYLLRLPEEAPRVVVVTPAGRRAYLEVLASYLHRQKRDFDEWQLWLNTIDPPDVEYIHALQRKHPGWVRVVEAPPATDGDYGSAGGGTEPGGGASGSGGSAPVPCGSSCVPPPEPTLEVPTFSIHNIYRFFRLAVEPHTIYLRLDDDIVFLEDGFIRGLAEARRRHPKPFLVFANIVNNGVISHKHQASGVFPYKQPLERSSFGRGWWDAEAALALHRAFLSDVRQGRLGRWRHSYDNFTVSERVSINAVAWFGSVMAAVHVEPEEEHYLTVVYLQGISARNLVLSSPICAHYGFYVQGPSLAATDILQQYRALAGLTGPGPGPA